jgi:hypothetical protein
VIAKLIPRREVFPRGFFVTLPSIIALHDKEEYKMMKFFVAEPTPWELADYFEHPEKLTARQQVRAERYLEVRPHVRHAFEDEMRKVNLRCEAVAALDAT